MSFRKQLQNELDTLEAMSMLRKLRVVRNNGALVRVLDQETGSFDRELVNLASNDYLGISDHPHIKEAVAKAVRKWGTGSGASKLVTGHSGLHADVEKSFASFKHAEAAILFPTGFMANLAVLTALAGPGDLICLDKLVHASLIDAARASGADVRTFPHLGYDKGGKLEKLLKRHLNQAGGGCEPGNNKIDEQNAEGLAGISEAVQRRPRRFIVTDSVFSMDGDVAQLDFLHTFAKEFDAVLVVDEAHGTGVLGEDGSGLAEAQGVEDKVDVTISTASKALGGLGGMVTADKLICDTILNHGRSIIYTTSIPPGQAAAIKAAVEVVKMEPQRRKQLHNMCLRFRCALVEQGWTLPELRDAGEVTPIFPLTLGSASGAIEASESLIAQGFLAPAIRQPTVGPGSERVRISLRADMGESALKRLIAATGELASVRTC